MSDASEFIGCKISLISKSEIRYEGILYSLNVADATISLSRVKSFGTEDRPTERPVPPRDEVYEFIIFRGSDIKAIDVVEPPKKATTTNDGLPNDPAIVEMSKNFQAPATPKVQTHPTSIGPVPVQVQASSAYVAAANSGFGGSAFVAPSLGTSPAQKIPPSTYQQQPHMSGTGMAAALLGSGAAGTSQFNDAFGGGRGSSESTPVFDVSNHKSNEVESQVKSGGRGGYRNQNQQRGGGDEKLRGGGRGRGGIAMNGSRGGGNLRQHGFQQQPQDGSPQNRQGQGYQPHEGQGYQPHQGQGLGGRGRGNYNNNSPRGGSGGYRGRGGYRNTRTQGILQAPQSAKVTFDGDFDFEKANEELKTAIDKLKLTEKANNDAAVSAEDEHHHEPDDENKEPQPPCYKKDDFFDSISCEALEREKGTGGNRPDWRAERKLNAETFGVSGERRGGGYYRGGGRGYYNNRGGGGGYGGGYRGHGGNRGGYANSRGDGGYRGYNNRYNGGGRGRGGGGNNANVTPSAGF